MVTKAEITWKVSPAATLKIAPTRKKLGEEAYKEDRNALQDLLCAYFSAEHECTQEQGKTISPLGVSTKPGWRCFKVRWTSPGSGKSSGFRFAIAFHSKERKVSVCGAWLRNENPSDTDFAKALKDPDI